MPKTISASTRTHLRQDGTSLALCWRITREDGTVHRFTDHDEDIVFPSALSLTVSISAGERFRTRATFGRSAMESRAGLRVDNMDVVGLAGDGSDSNDVTVDDLETGKFSNAEIEIFQVNWQAPEDGVVPHQRGNLGEVIFDPDDGTYTTELRSLSDRLSINIGRVVGPKCDADLFDSRCGLTASTFEQSTEVESSSDNKTIVVPALEVILNAEPALTSGVRDQAVVEPAGQLRLGLGPEELGTPDRPFLVENTTDLDNIRNNPTAWYALTTDIDMSGFGFWDPIPSFRGGIDGRGHKIIGLDVDRPGNAEPNGTASFIERLEQGAVVRRLGFEGGVFIAGSITFYAAPLAGLGASATLANNFGRVEDCYAIGCEITTNSNLAAGLIGELKDLAQVRRCFSACIFTGLAGSAVGGVIANATDVSVTQEQNYTDDDRQGLAQDGTGETGTTRLTTAEAQDSTNLTGFDFVDVWRKPEGLTQAAYVDTGGETITFADADPDTITRDAGSWITDGFEDYDRITISGADQAGNNGTFDVVSVTATVLTLALAETLTADSDPGSQLTITAGKYPRLQVKEV